MAALREAARCSVGNFVRCGVTGWCLEVIFTGIHSLFTHDYSLFSHTSLLMFPIYGLGALIHPCSRLLKKQSAFVRGIFYMLCIFGTEYLSGNFLKKRGICPWDYSDSPLNINGLIRLDYAPLWFGTGLLFERMTKEKNYSEYPSILQ
ncbi:MAG: hypothetical protein ACI4C1_05895 [Lachnospiraceae bacterium]